MFKGFRLTATHFKTWLLILVGAFIIEMCIVPNFFVKKLKERKSDEREQEVPETKHNITAISGYSVGTYYSNWSPYEPRCHKPSDLQVDSLTHVYYAFFVIDSKTGAVKSSDSWSDFEISSDKGDKGCIKQLQRLKFDSKNNFKTIMGIGGWSNREAFKKISKSKKKVQVFIDSAVDTMFRYGFDGIDLDWEFPADDEREPGVYLEMMRGIRQRFDRLEQEIFGNATKGHPKFHLSVATPAFDEKLNILPISEMDHYVDLWNMMCYDYHGEWSELTGYHSNLYYAKHADKRHWHHDGDEETLSADHAIKLMLNEFNISSRKLVLGMAAYGRGFTKVEGGNSGNYINRRYKGVGGASEGEPGMWPYNQLPIKDSLEQFDDRAVSAFCFDPNTKTFVGYDNVRSMHIKGQYIKDLKLNGGFWWESCGDSQEPERSLLRAFTENIEPSPEFVSVFKNRHVQKFHRSRYHNDYLTGLLKEK